MTWSQFLPIEPCAKTRPRVTRRGTYMPKPYQDWRRRFVGMVDHGAAPMGEEIHVGLVVITKSGKMRPDLDNVLGAVLDALQDANVIANDRGVVAFSAEIRKGGKPGLHITVSGQ